MGTGEEINEGSLKSSVDALIGHVSKQNTILEGYPKMSFRVDILWTVFCVVVGVSLTGVLGLLGKALLNVVHP